MLAYYEPNKTTVYGKYYLSLFSKSETKSSDVMSKSMFFPVGEVTTGKVRIGEKFHQS